MPPLLEVMKEPLKRVAQDVVPSVPGPAPAGLVPTPLEPVEHHAPVVPTEGGSGGTAFGLPRLRREDDEPQAPAAPPTALREMRELPPREPIAVEYADPTPASSNKHRLFPIVLIALAVAAGLIAVVWSIAWRAGAESERVKMSQFQGESEGQEPGPKGSGEPKRQGEPERNPKKPNQPEKNERPSQQDKPASTTIPPGLMLDPRIPGNNYLIVAKMPAKHAEKAVAFLTDNGVPVLAFPDKKIAEGSATASKELAKAVSDNGLFFVIAAEGIPSGQRWRESEKKRLELQDKVVRLGLRFKREQKIPEDFSQSFWELKRPPR
jgi:hypothetical protein